MPLSLQSQPPCGLEPRGSAGHSPVPSIPNCLRNSTSELLASPVDDCRALRSRRCPWLCAAERCFLEPGSLRWDGANPFQEPVHVAASAPSKSSAGPWACLLKIRQECVLTALTRCYLPGLRGGPGPQTSVVKAAAVQSTPRLGRARCCPSSRGHSCPAAPLCIGIGSVVTV